MATAISPANFEAALGSCYDAIAAGNFQDAWKFYALAEVQHQGLAVSASKETDNVSRRQSLSGLKDAIELAQERSIGDQGRYEIHSRWVP